MYLQTEYPIFTARTANGHEIEKLIELKTKLGDLYFCKI